VDREGLWQRNLSAERKRKRKETLKPERGKEKKENEGERLPKAVCLPTTRGGSYSGDGKEFCDHEERGGRMLVGGSRGRE